MNQRTMICAGRVTTGPERKKRVKRLMLYHREEKASQKICWRDDLMYCPFAMKNKIKF